MTSCLWSMMRTVKGRWVAGEHGKIVRDVSLERQKGGHYHYRGTAAGQAVEGDLVPKDPAGVAGDRAVSERVRKAPAGKPMDFTVEQYIPAIDPNRLLSVWFARTPGFDRVVQRVENAQVTVEVDANGRAKHMEMPVGGATLVIDRVFERGTP